MALNTSGAISLAGTTAGQSIQIENGGNGTTQISLNDTAVRTLAGVASGAITMPTNFYGKSNRVSATVTLSANTQNYTLNPAKASGYVAGKTDIILNINSGVIVGSSSTTASLIVSGWATGDTVRINNSGYIVGKGGNASTVLYGTSGSGTLALSVSFATNINNLNIIGGGGGGGAISGTTYSGGWIGPYTGGGGAGNSVGTGANNGTTTTGGAGISGAVSSGAGGNLGAAGGAGTRGNGDGAGFAGAGGACTSGNSNITWIATGSRYGTLG